MTRLNDLWREGRRPRLRIEKTASGRTAITGDDGRLLEVLPGDLDREATETLARRWAARLQAALNTGEKNP